MQRRRFLEMAGTLAAVSPWITSFAKGQRPVSPEGFNHQTAPTQFADTNGIRFAYRRFGQKEKAPLVFFQHFGGNLDNWDPAITDGLAQGREVILFDNAGVASSSGTVPGTISQMATHAISFIQALNLKQVDLLGFSIGGMVAQMVAVDQPEMVRRLILIGTAPSNGEGPFPFTDEAKSIFAAKYERPDLWLSALFAPSKESQEAGRAFLTRLNARKIDRDAPRSPQAASAQISAMAEWGKQVGERFEYLAGIKQSILIVSGSHDLIIKPVNSFYLAEHLPHAELILLPDAGHSPQSQYPQIFVQQVTRFLNS